MEDAAKASPGAGVYESAGLLLDCSMNPHDVILDVGGRAVAKPADVRQALADLTKEGKRTVLMRVKSGDGMKFVAVPLGKA